MIKNIEHKKLLDLKKQLIGSGEKYNQKFMHDLNLQIKRSNREYQERHKLSDDEVLRKELRANLIKLNIGDKKKIIYGHFKFLDLNIICFSNEYLWNTERRILGEGKVVNKFRKDNFAYTLDTPDNFFIWDDQYKLIFNPSKLIGSETLSEYVERNLFTDFDNINVQINPNSEYARYRDSNNLRFHVFYMLMKSKNKIFDIKDTSFIGLKSDISEVLEILTNEYKNYNYVEDKK